MDAQRSLFKVINTRAQESSGLSYERNAQQLYIWHSIGSNSIEIAEPKDINNKLDLVSHLDAPKVREFGRHCRKIGERATVDFFVDDDNQDDWGILWFPITFLLSDTP